MKLEIVKDLELNNYSVTFNIIDITDVNKEQIKDYGVLKILIGGEIPITLDGVDTSFKMSEEIKEFPNGFPFTKNFKDAHYNGKGKEHAEAYIAEITKRAEWLVSELEARTDEFSGTQIVQL